MHTQTDITPGIMRTVRLASTKWRAQILFEGCHRVTEYAYNGQTEFDVSLHASTFYPNVSHVDAKEFAAELDHIKMFGCRSDVVSWSDPIDPHIQHIIEKHSMPGQPK